MTIWDKDSLDCFILKGERGKKRGREALRNTWTQNTWCCYVLSCFSRVQLFATQWTIACQASLSTEFSRQEHWSELLCPPPGGLPDPGIEPVSPKSPALAGKLFTTRATWEAKILGKFYKFYGIFYCNQDVIAERKVKLLSHVRLAVTPWTVAYQAPLSVGFSRQGYWSGLPFPSTGDSSRPRNQTRVSHIASRRIIIWATWEAQL